VTVGEGTEKKAPGAEAEPAPEGQTPQPERPDDPARRWQGRLALVGVAVLTCTAVVVVGHRSAGGAGSGGGVRVVETGFSLLDDPLYRISYGVVIENTTDEVAYHTIACVGFRRDEGEDGGCRDFTVEVLLPGQRVGFGALESMNEGRPAVTGISVQIEGPATWEDPDEHPRPKIVTVDLDVAYSPENHPIVSFDHQSEGEVVRNATAYTVLRDGDGEIVGAAGLDLDQPVRPQEQARHSIPIEAVVPDLATAEVYVFPSGL
jgi:hypothetical protein